MKSGRRWLVASGVVGALIVATIGFFVARRGTAQVQLVTVPGRDTVELTIYNSRDLTYAKERRNITLRQGTNLIQFNWAGTRIDPTSIQLEPVSDPEGVQVLEAILPRNLENALMWRVEAKEAGPQIVEVSYFISGLTWEADYMAFVNQQETKLRLRGYFTVRNNSGEDYSNAIARLVVGDIRMVSLDELRSVAAGARRKADGRTRRRYARAPAQADRVGVGQSIAEYYMYTIQGENTIDSGWSKKITALDVADVPVSVVYRYEPSEDVVRRLYTFVNDEANGLGLEPLPAGVVRVFMTDDAGKVSFVGQNRIEFTPISKEIKLDLGPELAVSVERKQMDYVVKNLQFNDDGDVSDFDTEEEIRIEARNFRKERVTLEIPEKLFGQWEMLSTSLEYERKDKNTIQYTLELEPGDTQVITYRVRRTGG